MNQPETTAVTEAREALREWMDNGDWGNAQPVIDAFEAAVRAEERTAQGGFDRTAEHSQHFGAPSEPSEQDIALAAEAMRSLVASKMAGIPGSTMVLDLDDLRRWPTFYADVARAALQAVWR